MHSFSDQRSMMNIFHLLSKREFLNVLEGRHSNICSHSTHIFRTCLLLCKQSPKLTALTMLNSSCICRRVLLLPTAQLFGYFHFCTVTQYSMVNDVVLAIVPIVPMKTMSPCNMVYKYQQEVIFIYFT